MHGVAGVPNRSVTPCGKPSVRTRGVRLSPVHSSNKFWGLSSDGRAPALQAGCHRFDPDRLHQVTHRPDRKEGNSLPSTSREKLEQERESNGVFDIDHLC